MLDSGVTGAADRDMPKFVYPQCSGTSFFEESWISGVMIHIDSCTLSTTEASGATWKKQVEPIIKSDAVYTGYSNIGENTCVQKCDPYELFPLLPEFG